MLVGYMRVSTDGDRQVMDLQHDALLAAGVDERHLFEDHASGSRGDRTGLAKALAFLRPDDCLVVWKLDRRRRRCCAPSQCYARRTGRTSSLCRNRFCRKFSWGAALAHDWSHRFGWGRQAMIEFKGSHFEREVILWGVRWYVAYPISYRQLEEMMQERGVEVDHSTLNRWVLKYVPLLDQQFRTCKRLVGSSWRMDETYVRVKGAWK